jgi:hypothetical protein
MVSARLRDLAVFVVLLAPSTASAGRTDFGWLFGTETMPERGVELQSWVYEENGRPGLPDETSLWWGPVIGITDQLELSLPIEASWQAGGTFGGPGFTLTDYGADLRYRFVSADPVEAGPLVPLVRLAVKRDVLARDSVIVEGDFVLGYQDGRVHALLDAGVTSEFSSAEQYVYARPGAGVSIQAVGDLRFGAEVTSYVQVAGDGDYQWVAAGPNLAWTHGRFWLSAAFAIGIYHIETAPRITWGIAF